MAPMKATGRTTGLGHRPPRPNRSRRKPSIKTIPDLTPTTIRRATRRTYRRRISILITTCRPR